MLFLLFCNTIHGGSKQSDTEWGGISRKKCPNTEIIIHNDSGVFRAGPPLLKPHPCCFPDRALHTMRMCKMDDEELWMCVVLFPCSCLRNWCTMPLRGRPGPVLCFAFVVWGAREHNDIASVFYSGTIYASSNLSFCVMSLKFTSHSCSLKFFVVAASLSPLQYIFQP